MRRASAKRRRTALAAAPLAALALALAILAPAAAAAPKTLWETCQSPQGGEAGQCRIPRGIVADPDSGHLFVSDQSNRRIVELTAWGEFVKAWGWGVRDGAAELQVCTEESGCLQGLAGSGSGQFGSSPQGIARDSGGNLYVVDFSNRRVHKFAPDGSFLLTFGGEVNETTNANVCTAASGDECGAGVEGAAPGYFGAWDVSSFIAVGPGDVIYVGDVGRIQKFDSGGNYLDSIALPGETVQSLAVDGAGNLFVALTKSQAETAKADVRKLAPSGAPICTATVTNPRALASDPGGNLYVVDQSLAVETFFKIRTFGPDCAEDAAALIEDGLNLKRSTGIATNVVTEAGEVALYVGNMEGQGRSQFLRAYYPPPDKWDPPVAAPEVSAPFAVSAGTDSAVVKAKVNPLFWDDTTYWVQYGTEPCSLGGCAEKPLEPGTPLGAGVVDEDITTKGVILPDLQPERTYHFRFLAQSGGGGPTIGPESTFTTFPPAPPPPNPDRCPNALFRTGPGAYLPDCRAYEMVSPIDKGAGEIVVLTGITNHPFGNAPARLHQGAPDGEAVSYSSAAVFAGAVSSPWSSQYLAEREPTSGWRTRPLNAPRGNVSLYSDQGKEIPFAALSEDLCAISLLQDTDYPLVPGAPPGVPNLYRRDNCGAGGFELLTNTPPPGYSEEAEPLSSGYFPYVQGYAGAKTLIRANAALSEGAAPGKGFQVYEMSGGVLHLVSVLPDGQAATGHSSLGTPVGTPLETRSESIWQAVSNDGSRVFWTNGGNGAAELFLRANPDQPQSASGGCDEAGKACTLQITATPSYYWGADAAGSAVIYQSGETLFESQIEESEGTLTSTPTQIATGVQGVMGMSEDATRVYLISTDGSLAAGGQGGEPNLYLWERGSGFELVAVLGASDISGLTDSRPTINSLSPGFRLARVSPDGSHAAFVSRAPLSGYDNTDAVSGEADAEVFRYDAAAGELACVSCNMSGARPSGRQLGESIPHFWASGMIGGWESGLHASRALSADGSRLFFESYEALVPADTNGARDVYEWSEAEGKAGCTAIGAPLYVPASGGCLSLISSGRSSADSEFIDASANGRDVFFTTGESLFAEDPGLVDLYDARIGGGFAIKPKRPPCQGESCQSPASPPPAETPASAAVHGEGNLVQPRRARRCPKGKRRVRRAGKTRCVKRERHRQRHKRHNRKPRRAHR